MNLENCEDYITALFECSGTAVNLSRAVLEEVCLFLRLKRVGEEEEEEEECVLSARRVARGCAP